MSAHAADSNFEFQLPRLSYIDAKWEEPELRAPAATAAPARSSGLGAWLAGRLSAVVAWYRADQEAAELASMTDRDLMDIGISRSDLVRVFDPAFNKDLRQRGC